MFVLALAPPARAQNDAARADALKRRADELALQGEPLEALAMYNEALAIAKSPILYYNRGRALQTLGRYVDALDDIDAFAREASPDERARVPGLARIRTDLVQHVARVVVVCSEDGARVSFNGQPVGTTPFAAAERANQGKLALAVAKDGFWPYERVIDIPGGGESRIEVTLKKREAEARVRVTSPVVGATAYIDEQRVGAVPAERVVAVGTHVVRVEHAGDRAASKVVVTSAGETAIVDVPLTAEPSLVTRWWFWSAVGAAVLGGAALTYVVTRPADAHSGSIAPGSFVAGAAAKF